MTAYDAGTAFLSIVPSFRGVQQSIDAEVAKWNASIRKGLADAIPAAFRDGSRAAAPEGTKAGDAFGGAFARTVRAKIDAALKNLPKVELKADSSDTDVKIAAIRAQLEELRDKRIGVDIDEGLALAQIAALQTELDHLGDEDPSISVRINAASASAELAGIQAEVDRLDGRTVHVDVDVNKRGSGLDSIGNPLSLAGVGLAAAPLAIPVGAAALGSLGGAATVAGAGAAGLGVAALGLSGLTKAIQSVQAAHVAAAAAATTGGAQQVRAALAAAAAERGVQSAVAGLAQARANAADAAISAAERVQSALQAEATAEQQLAAAQQTEKDAQTALTEARKTAAQQLQDLNTAVADGQLSQRQAVLDVQNAQLNLQTVNSSPTSTPLQREQAQLDYDTAVQHLKDLQIQQARLAATQADAAKKGVNGADVVVQAQRNLQQATLAVTAAYQAQAAAEQGVSDARRQQAAQARQSAYAISQAEAQIVSAQAAVTSSSLRTTNATQAQVAALSPVLLRFATFVNDTLRPAFDRLKLAAQNALLPDLQQGITNLLPILPALTTFVGDLAKTMGDLFVQASRALTSPFWQQFGDFIGRTAGPVLTEFAHIIGNVITGLAGLVEAFYPVTQQIGGGLVALTAKFADFGRHASDPNSGFQGFLQYVKTEGPIVAQFFGDLLLAVGHLTEALAPFGAELLNVLSSLTGFLSALSPGQLLGIAEAATAMFLVFKVGLIALKVNALEGATAFGVLNVVMDANPIGLVALAVGGLVAGLTFLGKGSKDAAVNTDLLGDSEKRLTDAVTILNEEVRKSIDNFTILRNGALTQERANENLQSAFDAVTKSVAQNGRTLDINTEAGRNNRAALLDVATALNDKVTADFKANQSTLGYAKALAIASEQVKENRRRLIDLAVQSGLTKDAAKGLVDQILLTPKQVVTNFKTPGLVTAQARADNLTKSLKALRDGTWLVKFILQGATTTQGGATDLTTLLTGGVVVPAKKAAGGPIHGPGTGTSDTAGLFALSNGEHVWTAREVDALGGHGQMLALRRSVLSGLGFAAGGPVGYDAKALSLAASPGMGGLMAGLSRGQLLTSQQISQVDQGRTIGEYHQHFHNPVPEPASHSAAVGARRLLQDLSG